MISGFAGYRTLGKPLARMKYLLPREENSSFSVDRPLRELMNGVYSYLIREHTDKAVRTRQPLGSMEPMGTAGED